MDRKVFENKNVVTTPRSFPKEDELDSLPQTFKGTYIQISSRWRYTARITGLLEMIKYSYGIEDWDIIDLQSTNNGPLQSKWIDTLQKYISGEAVSFGEFWIDMKKDLEFSLREINLIETGEVDQRLWAIFTVLVNPNLPIKYS